MQHGIKFSIDEKTHRVSAYEYSDWEEDGIPNGFRRGFTVKKGVVRVWVRRSRGGRMVAGSFCKLDRDGVSEIIARSMANDPAAPRIERMLRVYNNIPSIVRGLPEVLWFLVTRSYV
jgi:hypothetical protein